MAACNAQLSALRLASEVVGKDTTTGIAARVRALRALRRCRCAGTMTLVYTDYGVPGASVAAFLSTMRSLKLAAEVALVEDRPCVTFALKSFHGDDKQPAPVLIESLQRIAA